MKALRFNLTIPRYVLGKLIGSIFTSFYWNGLSCTVLDDIPDPELPSDEWVLVKTRFGGICGSDLDVIHLNTSPYLSVYSSTPMVFGHENNGTIAKIGSAVSRWQEGDRVVVEPLLWCVPRGFKDLCRFCARGEINRCERFTQGGDLSAGLSIGACADTSGSWSPYFLAHQSQLYRVPGSLSDENALMVEPLAVGIHAVLENQPREGETILIIGAGTIGLVTLGALRALGFENKVVVLSKYEFQAEAARRLRADDVIAGVGEKYTLEALAEISQAKQLKPILGRSVLIGGFDLVYDCVGSDRSLDDALRSASPGGRVVLLGIPGTSKHVDWSAAFINELDVRASYVYNHADVFEATRWKTFDLALSLLAEKRLDLGWMITQKFRLEEYKHAFQVIQRRRDHRVLKAVFSFDGQHL